MTSINSTFCFVFFLSTMANAGVNKIYLYAKVKNFNKNIIQVETTDKIIYSLPRNSFDSRIKIQSGSFYIFKVPSTTAPVSML